MNKDSEVQLSSIDLDRPWMYFPHTAARHLSRGAWQAWSYLVMVSDIVVDLVARGNQKVIFTLPPRHGKSQLISQWVPVWFLNLWPHLHVLLSSYGAELSIKFGRWVRNEIISHQAELDVRISKDSTSVSRWHTAQGGSMVSLGVGGSVTGRGGNLIIADDLVKNWADSQSETLRKRLREWFLSTLLTRLEPGGTCILTQTRWNSEDLTGYLLREHGDQWREIRLPALAEANDPLGRVEGVALCPERYSVEDLVKIREQMGTNMFQSLYQQNPSAPESSIFNRDWWKFFHPNEQPSFAGVIQSLDCGYQKTEEAAFSVCLTVGVAKNGYFVVDVLRERLDFPALVRTVKLQHKKFNPELILVEAGGSGISLAQSLFSETRLPIKAVQTRNKSKQSRAWEVSGMVEAGQVLLPEKAPWLGSFLEELTLFPNSKFTDQTDALSQALDFLRNYRPRGGDKPRERPSSGRELLYPDHSRKLREPRQPTGLFNSNKWMRTTLLP